MIRALLFIAFAIAQPSAFATVYKCTVESGKVEYQATPCTNTRNSSQRVLQTPAVASSQSPTPSDIQKKCVKNEISINFANMPLQNTLQVIADYSGNKLSLEPSVNVSGAFHYICVKWEDVLKDISSKYNVSIKVEGGTIYVQPR